MEEDILVEARSQGGHQPCCAGQYVVAQTHMVLVQRATGAPLGALGKKQGWVAPSSEKAQTQGFPVIPHYLW